MFTSIPLLAQGNLRPIRKCSLSAYLLPQERTVTQQNHILTTWRFCYYKFQNKMEGFPHDIYNLQNTILIHVCQLEITAVC